MPHSGMGFADSVFDGVTGASRLRLSVMLGVILEPCLAQRLKKLLELSLLVVIQRGENAAFVTAVLLRLFALVFGNLAAKGEQIDKRMLAV